MPKLSEAARFERTLSELLTKRENHVKGLAEIDALFARYGIAFNGHPAHPASTHTAPPASKQPSKRDKRRRFSQTADEFVLSLLKSGKRMVTGEINAAWKKSGRGGTADNSLTKLVKEKKVTRTPIKDGRGSTYTLS